MSNQNVMAELLNQAIKESTYSKSEIARLLGVSRPTVQGWVKNGTISKANLAKLCSLLGKPISDFIQLTSVGIENNDSTKMQQLKTQAKYLIDNIEEDDDIFLLMATIKLLR